MDDLQLSGPFNSFSVISISLKGDNKKDGELHLKLHLCFI